MAIDTIILGDGRLGRAIEAALRGRGDHVRILGRPAGGRRDPIDLAGADVTIDASRGDAVAVNVAAASAAGCRRFVIATTGWDAALDSVRDGLTAAGAAAVVAPNLSLGAAVFLRLVEQAAFDVGRLRGFDPFVVEWHRAAKADRPSGTAREISRRLVSAGAARAPEVAVIRAGESPGMHLVGFDSAGETLELRLTARDRSAYAAGAIAAVDWLVGRSRSAGIHTFDEVVDDLLTGTPLAATA